MNRTETCFLEIESRRLCKAGQHVCGDVFTSRRMTLNDRIVSVLSDGLGSGIKAGVLAHLTATFAGRCIAGSMEARKTAELIMSILPVCRERKIAYATFTIADVGRDGSTVLIEFGNPPALWMRGEHRLEIPRQALRLTRPDGVEDDLWFSRFNARTGDRLAIFSDGLPQAGMGRRETPLGWGHENIVNTISSILREEPGISARQLVDRLLNRACQYDQGTPKDDMTCGVIALREPRHLLVVTGPPMAPERDREMACCMNEFEGRRIVCGGTTSSLIARELQRPIHLRLDDIDPDIPPPCRMEGADLVTEGTLTLAEVVRLLEYPDEIARSRPHAAREAVDLLLDSDVIHFLVGTRINEAHQDPNVPVDLDIRRNIVKRIRHALEQTFFKETHLRYI